MIKFRARIEATGPPTGCQLWPGATRGPGRDEQYGVVYWGKRSRSAHVVAWELEHGRLMLPGMIGCHTCHVPLCCNWRHVYEGTHASNRADKLAAGRDSPPPVFRGQDSTSAKLTDEDVYAIRAALARGVEGKTLATQYSIGEMQVSRIRHRTRWGHLPERP